MAVFDTRSDNIGRYGYEGPSVPSNHVVAACPVGAAGSNRGHTVPQPKLTKQWRARAAARQRAARLVKIATPPGPI